MKGADNRFIHPDLAYHYNKVTGDYANMALHDPNRGGIAIGCARDKDRTIALMNKVYTITKENDVVIDLGAGLGLLGIAALVKGAKHVYFVEGNFNCPFTAYIGLALNSSEFSESYDSIQADVTQPLNLPEGTKIDHVICELINTGLMKEPQTQAIDNIVKGGWTHENTRFSPLGARSYIHLVNELGQELTSKEEYCDINFSRNQDSGVDKEVQLENKNNGIATNAIMATQLYYEDQTTTGEFKTLCQPRELRIVKEGKEFKPEIKVNETTTIRLRYAFGCSQNPKVEIR